MCRWVRAQVAAVKEDSIARDGRWRLTTDRLRKQLADAHAERDEMKAELAYLEKCRQVNNRAHIAYMIARTSRI